MEIKMSSHRNTKDCRRCSQRVTDYERRYNHRTGQFESKKLIGCLVLLKQLKTFNFINSCVHKGAKIEMKRT